MKKLIFLFLAFILAISTYSREEKTVKIHITANFNLSDVVELVPGSGWYIPASGSYSGHVTHLGVLDQMNSNYTLNSWIVGIETVTQFSSGEMTRANGESLFFTAVAVFQRADHSGICTVTVNGGTGRYEDATGIVIITGYLDPPAMYHWTGEGTISY